MPLNPVCESFIPKLSPLMDSELPAAERVQVESHVASCSECAARAADFRAESALVRLGMELLADEADFRDFSKNVMARIAPEPVPLRERWRVSLSELFTYRRGMMVSFAGAAAALLALAPMLLRSGVPEGYASERMAVQAVSTNPDAHVAPVVMSGDRGNAIIWLVSHKHVLEGKPAPLENSQADAQDTEAHPEPLNTKMNQERPRGGEL
jgi:anti-sigma factor RsiW